MKRVHLEGERERTLEQKATDWAVMELNGHWMAAEIVASTLSPPAAKLDSGCQQQNSHAPSAPSEASCAITTPHTSVESGANNVVFIRTRGIEPENLVHHILKDIHTTKKKKTRVILRMLPISGTCKAFLEDMKKYTETFFEPWFKAPNKSTFQIVYKARNNSHMNREEVIKELAGIVGSLNPENKVDLNNPQHTVVVEIIKNVCCLSVVRDYVLFRKYNLQEVVKSNKEDTQQNPSNVSEEQNSTAVKQETMEGNLKEVIQEQE
ncbi:THUMP domain-containing protein 1 [Meleagris gallopavo]|uniref:THUMP domain-containing protein 1 n=1 Tax=Meleagris gallopavo TaxID=9103 RepID=UPI0005499600|nr:THUMP domain-containing protein 1 [Meleagris gallopavo]